MCLNFFSDNRGTNVFIKIYGLSIAIVNEYIRLIYYFMVKNIIDLKGEKKINSPDVNNKLHLGYTIRMILSFLL